MTLSGFVTSAYWSSSEYGSYDAWIQNFDLGLRRTLGKNSSFAVRVASVDFKKGIT